MILIDSTSEKWILKDAVQLVKQKSDRIKFFDEKVRLVIHVRQSYSYTVL